jgi:LysR family transcriptional regulator, hydrogen peroxide-inducible genes activator
VRQEPFDFSLRQLQYFLAVAETSSFRKAAELCRVAQPSLSAQIAALETALGVKLFERDNKRVLTTRAGALLLGRARATLIAAAELETAALQSKDPLSATLRIGVIPTISPYLLPIVTPALREALPALRIIWVEDKTTTLTKSLAAGELDAALLALEGVDGDFVRAMIAVDPFALATPYGHPLGVKKRAAAPKELEDIGVLLLDDGHCFRDQALAFCGRAHANELAFRATSLSTLAQMVASGAGVTLLPKLAIASERQRAAIEIRPFGQPGPHRTIGLISRRGAALSPAIRAVAATLKAAYPL